MKDNCYIDGVSTAQQYGVCVLKGGYSDLLAFPSMADPDSNDWPEEDGLEVDLTDPHIETKEIDITFLAADSGKASDFKAMLGTSGLHTLRIPALNRSWLLRMSDNQSNVVYNRSVSVFKIRFIEDNPIRPSDATAGPGLVIHDTGYELDGVSFADFGIMVLNGKSEITRMPTAKMNLNRKISTLDGQIYDAETLVFKHKEVTFKCLLKASSIANMWACYDAFLKALLLPGERQLYASFQDEQYPCYYKKSSSFNVVSLGIPLMSFDLTFVFTSFRINATEYLLSTEDGILIETEDEQYVIDLG